MSYNKSGLYIAAGLLTAFIIEYLPVYIGIAITVGGILIVLYLTLFTARKYTNYTNLLISIGISGLILITTKIFDTFPEINSMYNDSYIIIRFIILVLNFAFLTGAFIRCIYKSRG